MDVYNRKRKRIADTGVEMDAYKLKLKEITDFQKSGKYGESERLLRIEMENLHSLHNSLKSSPPQYVKRQRTRSPLESLLSPEKESSLLPENFVTVCAEFVYLLACDVSSIRSKDGEAYAILMKELEWLKQLEHVHLISEEYTKLQRSISRVLRVCASFLAGEPENIFGKVLVKDFCLLTLRTSEYKDIEENIKFVRAICSSLAIYDDDSIIWWLDSVIQYSGERVALQAGMRSKVQVYESHLLALACCLHALLNSLAESEKIFEDVRIAVAIWSKLEFQKYFSMVHEMMILIFFVIDLLSLKGQTEFDTSLIVLMSACKESDSLHEFSGSTNLRKVSTSQWDGKKLGHFLLFSIIT